MSAEQREYPLSRQLLLNAVWDLCELQKGIVTIDDTSAGIIEFKTNIYDFEHVFFFEVTEVADGCALRVKTSAEGKESHEFLLLENLLLPDR